MPIYEYQCGQCEHQFEVIQKINDSPIAQCPRCLHNSAKKLVSAAAFKLKGTGWYATDFKDKKPGSKPSEKNESKSVNKESDH